MSLADVSKRASELGAPLSLNGLSKIELGNRGVDLDEVVALARALRVPPVLLILPLGREAMVEVLPGTKIPTWAAVKWFTGEAPFPTKSDGSWIVDGTDYEDWVDAATKLFRELDELDKERSTARSRAGAARKAAAAAKTDEEARDHERQAVRHERMARSAENLLRRHRAAIRAAGLDPGELLPGLMHLDEPEAEELERENTRLRLERQNAEMEQRIRELEKQAAQDPSTPLRRRPRRSPG